MRVRAKLKINNLDKWQAWLKQCQAEDVDRMKGRIVRSVGLRVLEYAQDNTPVQTGRLASSLNYGAKENFFEVKVTKAVATVKVGTTVEYAAAIEDGYSQEDRKGEFIPGTWGANGLFNYNPEEYPKGMVLTGNVIPGAHMFRKAVKAVNGDDYSRITEFEYRRLYAELAGG